MSSRWYRCKRVQAYDPGWITEVLVLICIVEENKLDIIRWHVVLKTSENSNSKKLILWVLLPGSLVCLPIYLPFNITNSYFSASRERWSLLLHWKRIIQTQMLSIAKTINPLYCYTRWYCSPVCGFADFRCKRTPDIGSYVLHIRWKICGWSKIGLQQFAVADMAI